MLPSLSRTLSLLTTVVSIASAATIQKDVVIIGGGASGAYAAVRLKEDYGKSILLVEKQDILVSWSKPSLRAETYSNRADMSTHSMILPLAFRTTMACSPSLI